MAGIPLRIKIASWFLNTPDPAARRQYSQILVLKPNDTGAWLDLVPVGAAQDVSADAPDTVLTAVGDEVGVGGGAQASDGSQESGGEDPEAQNLQPGEAAIPDASLTAAGEGPAPDGGLAASAAIPDAPETASGETPAPDGGLAASAAIPDAPETATGETPAPDGGTAAAAAASDAAETATGETPAPNGGLAANASVPDAAEAAEGDAVSAAAIGGNVSVPDGAEAAAGESPAIDSGLHFKTTINGNSYLGDPDYSHTDETETVLCRAGTITVNAWADGGDSGNEAKVYLYVDGVERDSIDASPARASKTLSYAVSAGSHTIRILLWDSGNGGETEYAGSISIPIP